MSETLFDYAERNAILARHETANPGFVERARAFVLAYLAEHGPSSGEWLTDRCVEAGIKPESDTRAFGAVFGGLSKRGLIERHGFCLRDKGHSCAGGIVWRITSQN